MNYLEVALNQAQKALNKNEVPIGAVIVKDNKIISCGYNKREKSKNALHHAEIIAINKACKKLKSWRLNDCTMYVTLEPCAMCAGAILNARLKKVVIGCLDENHGAVISKYNLLTDGSLNHKTEIEYLENKDCKQIVQNFFKKLRKK